jgi:hypothetical protein
MKTKIYLCALIITSCINTWAANYELPILNNESPYYYVPQSKLEKQEKGLFSSVSYTAGSGYFESWSGFFGCRRCDLQNIILVNKKTKERKALFDSERKISSFFVTNESDAKKKIPQLLFAMLKTGPKGENFEFYIANLNGTNLIRVSPEGQTVVSFDFDIFNKKLILLLRTISAKDDVLNPSRPFIVDLQKVATAVPLMEN